MSVRHQFTLDLISMHLVYPHLPCWHYPQAQGILIPFFLSLNISDQYAAVEAMNFWSGLLLTDLGENFAHLEVFTDFYSRFVWQLESLKLR